MTRRNFLQYSLAGSASMLLPWAAESKTDPSSSSITFGLVADPHQDLLHDVEERMEKFIQASNSHATDFILQLGDFCHPKKENKAFMDIWNSYDGPRYHVLGNHDMDLASKEGAMEYFGMPAKYYSFDEKGFHFVVLDANYINQAGQYLDYDNSNFYIDSQLRTWINPEQLEWLEADLATTELPTIVFSHQSLVSDLWGVKNRTKVQRILEKANEKAGFNKVIACFNGHNHIDFYRKLNGIYYIDINSMSYLWVGEKYQCHTRYPKAIYDKYPHLSKMATYEDALYAVVTVGAGLLKIEGSASKWVGPSPEELGLTESVYGVSFVPEIESRNLAVE